MLPFRVVDVFFTVRDSAVERSVFLQEFPLSGRERLPVDSVSIKTIGTHHSLLRKDGMCYCASIRFFLVVPAKDVTDRAGNIRCQIGESIAAPRIVSRNNRCICSGVRPGLEFFQTRNRALLISAVHPEAGFSVGNAMGRNRLIYGLSRAAATRLFSRICLALTHRKMGRSPTRTPYNNQ